ncbi:MAG: S41 family peptidase [Bacteroidales bacterium]
MNIVKSVFRKKMAAGFLGLLLMFTQTIASAQVKSDFEIAKNLEIFATLYRTLNANYVDDLKHGKLFETAIESMLESLDPYTNYIPETQREDYMFMTTGQYGGIGAVIQQRGDYVIVSEPYEGAPAHKAGLIAGDKILEINGQSAKNKSVSDVSTILKGQPGTDVNVLIERLNQKEPMLISITRENVKVNDIPYYGMLEDDIAYINLSSFTQTASSAVKKAFKELESKSEVKGLIIDLRGNGGGLLNEAVEIVGMFVPQGEMVVSTKGKLNDSNRVHKTTSQPLDLKIPIAVLVNNHSASASEIVAGAFQDLDRAVIVGQRTLGKGLVQNVIPLVYNSSIKVTVAKYYIPSGRCIQAIDYFHEDENGAPLVIPDSLKTAFTTRNGRTVYESAGIEPDVTIDPKTLGSITVALVSNHLIFDFANQFYQKNAEIAPAEEFEITDQIYEEFKDFVSKNKVEYQIAAEKSLEKLKSSLSDDMTDKAREFIEGMEEEIAAIKQNDLLTYENEIRQILLSEIVTRYYFQRGRVVATLNKDEVVEKALEILHDNNKYKDVIGNGSKSNTNGKG